MAKNRRGREVDDDARANGDAIKSSAGSASATPVPFNNVRRDSGRRLEMIWLHCLEAVGDFMLSVPPTEMGRYGHLFVQEQVTFHNRLHEAANTVFIGFGLLDDLLNRRAIAEPDRRTGGINHQMPREIARDLRLVLQHELLELSDVVEFPAIPKLPLRFNRQRVVEIKRPAVLALAELRKLILGVSTIEIAPAPHDVEILQREALWIDLVVTIGTTLVRPMLGELLAYRYRPTRIGIDGRHA